MGGSDLTSKQTQLVQTLGERLQQPDGQVERDIVQGGEVLDDACLRRWLRADGWAINKAEKRLRAHAKWRVQFVPNGRIDESEVQNELDADKIFLQGRDKSGRTCVVVTAAHHIVSQRNVDECKRCICYTLDRAIEQVDTSVNPDGQLCIIFDLRGLGVANLDVPITRSVFDTLANHYPERMGVLYMFDAPWVFWGLWKCVSPFIEANTLAKVQFVYASDPTQLQQNFDINQLPEEFGGKAPLVPIQKTAEAQKAQKAANGQQADDNNLHAGAQPTALTA